jgi:hypothetical protein
MAAQQQKKLKEPMPPLSVWVHVVAVAWLVPGGGHIMLHRKKRGVLLMFSVLTMFLFGLMMRGAFFSPQGGDLLTTVIYCGGFLSNVLGGVPYFLAIWLGYSQPDVAGMVYDYGTKFLVGAGLLNVLAMVDAFEIAAGRKN